MTGDPPAFIVEADVMDLHALVALEARCATHPWSERHFRSEMEPRHRARTLVVRAATGDGYGEIVAFCAFRLVADEIHVHNLGVAPERRRRGLGRRLLRTSLDAGVRAGGRRALLEVRASNEAALRLYAGEGFQEVGRRRSYYADPVEDAVVMSRTL
jgi:[ribosomal protein S18]-alanine N-acetyltransferase